MNGGADELLERLSRTQIELVVLGVAYEKPLAFQQSGYAPADVVQQMGELGWGRPPCSVELRLWSFEAVDTVQEEHVEVNLAG
jgi:hypothetical protein